MSANDQGATHSISDGGVTGTHPPAEPFRLLVAPATANEFNLVRFRIIPIACWRVEDIRFQFDSSFPLPDITAEMQALQRLRRRHPDAPLSIFGHADPVGNDDYNKTLSGRRATAIYGMLTRNTGLWNALFNQPFGGDKWGRQALETMFVTVSPGAGQMPAGLEHDPGQQRKLFSDYMDKLCGPQLKLAKTEFLGRGADSLGKADYQGCGEFNPVLIFSQAKFLEFERDEDKSLRNAANAPNRRVMALLFRKGSRVDPARWPCPRATEGVADCKKRFFSDGEKRRTTRLPDKDRKFDDTEDTFACRFHQRITSGSPCRKLTSNVFRYGLELSKHLPWTEAATFRIAATDGSQERLFSMDEGTPSGNLREFVFSEARPRVLYKGQVIEGDLQLDLFAAVELFRVQEPGDPTNNLPLPFPETASLAEQAEAAPPPVSAPAPPPGGDSEPGELLDFDVEEEALPGERVDTIF